MKREHHGLGQRLGQDLNARKGGLGSDPPGYVVHILGPRRSGGSDLGLWDEAAARIDQHRTAYDLAEWDPTLGSRPSLWGRSAFATSQLEVANACERVKPGLGRAREIEPPGLELEIGL